MRRVYGRKVARLTLGDLVACLLRARNIERCFEGRSEVSRGRSSLRSRADEGPNLSGSLCSVYGALSRCLETKREP